MKLIQSVSTKNINVSILDTIKHIKQAGFNSVFIKWLRDESVTTNTQQVELCNQLGLEIQFAHLSYEGINNIWFEGQQGDDVMQAFIEDIKQCHNHNINLVIIHLTARYEVPCPNEIGITRLKRIADYAQQLGVKIAFENTRQQGFLEYVLGNLNNANIGICFDVGHYHCYFKDQFNWEYFKNKILCVHLHDNDGEDDRHWLPFDGTINWQDVVKKLKAANYNGPVTIETNYNRRYAPVISVQEYFNKSFKRANEIKQLFESENI